MTAPRAEITHMTYQNPDASGPLILPILVVSNTPDEDLRRNVRINSARDLPWVKQEEPHDGVAVLVGGGPSLTDTLDEIRDLANDGATVFAVNAAATKLFECGIPVDYQIIGDAKPETAQLVDHQAASHLFASQCHPDTVGQIENPVIWHLGIDAVEASFPEEKFRRGGYVLFGGGAAIGNSSFPLAYAMGFRDLHGFAFDSCHRGEASHAYDQPMNQFIPVVETTWAGKTYRSSVAMKAQAEKFQIIAQSLKRMGCKITLHGDGLLQAIYKTPPKDLSERDKYTLIWQMDSYRESSPGERAVAQFLDVAKPEGLIIDFGCGTGRAGVELFNAGHDVCLVDFADNCRDQEALALPFLLWDLNHPCPLSAPYGICADMMEHIPPDDVATVIRNIMGSARTVFFQISTIPDKFGAIIGQSLHLSVHQAPWWREQFEKMGFNVAWQDESAIDCRLLVERKENE